MKGIKVVDVGSNPEETIFGTCEICMGYGTADNPYMVLEFPDGTQVEIDTFDWSWGDYFEYHVDNVVNFSAWLSERDISDEEEKRLRKADSEVLIDLIQEYKYREENDG